MIDINHMNTVAQHDIYVVHFQEGSYIHRNYVSINILRERKHSSTATLFSRDLLGNSMHIAGIPSL